MPAPSTESALNLKARARSACDLRLGHTDVVCLSQRVFARESSYDGAGREGRVGQTREERERGMRQETQRLTQASKQDAGQGTQRRTPHDDDNSTSNCTLSLCVQRS